MDGFQDQKEIFKTFKEIVKNMISLFNRFRSLLFSPNSRLELWLRTIYHKLNATRFLFCVHHIAALRSYRKWRSIQNKNHFHI